MRNILGGSSCLSTYGPGPGGRLGAPGLQKTPLWFSSWLHLWESHSEPVADFPLDPPAPLAPTHPTREQEDSEKCAFSLLPTPTPFLSVPSLGKKFLSQRPARRTPPDFSGPWAQNPHPGASAAGHSRLPVPSCSAVGWVPWARGQGVEVTS